MDTVSLFVLKLSFVYVKLLTQTFEQFYKHTNLENCQIFLLMAAATSILKRTHLV